MILDKAISNSGTWPVKDASPGRAKRTCSLKLTTNIWSCGLLERAKARAAAMTSARFFPILPLLSITRPTVTGISSWLKYLICWSAPSSYTWKFSWSSPETSMPSWSRAAACKTTRLELTLIRYGASGRSCDAEGACDRELLHSTTRKNGTRYGDLRARRAAGEAGGILLAHSASCGYERENKQSQRSWRHEFLSCMGQ